MFTDTISTGWAVYRSRIKSCHVSGVYTSGQCSSCCEAALRKWKWSLQLCFFDPALSVCLGTLPVTEAAAGRRYPLLGVSPGSTDRGLDSFGQPQLPSSTNKAINPIRRSSSGIQSRMNYNDRHVICQNHSVSSTEMFARFYAGSERDHSRKPYPG